MMIDPNSRARKDVIRGGDEYWVGKNLRGEGAECCTTEEWGMLQFCQQTIALCVKGVELGTQPIPNDPAFHGHFSADCKD